MKKINKITTFTKALFKFAFGLIMGVINFFFLDVENKTKVNDPLSNDQSHDPSLDWGDTHDDGWID